MTIEKAYNQPSTVGDYYYIEERIDWTWTNDMIECLVGNPDDPIEVSEKS